MTNQRAAFLLSAPNLNLSSEFYKTDPSKQAGFGRASVVLPLACIITLTKINGRLIFWCHSLLVVYFQSKFMLLSAPSLTHNLKGGEDLFSNQVGQRETLVPRVVLWATVRARAAGCPAPPFPMVHGTRLGRRRLDVIWRRSRFGDANLVSSAYPGKK